MNTKKYLGICMDHSNAHLIEFKDDSGESKTIESKFKHQEKEHSIGKSEQLMHNKEQHEQSEYYNKLGEVIKRYDDVLLFGPTQAKDELFNLLRKDHQFEKINIRVEHSDKLTENQEHAFVKKYFAKHC
ncbi:MAG: hypothetical protein WCL14_13615 [Bacteroidota bacterium]